MFNLFKELLLILYNEIFNTEDFGFSHLIPFANKRKDIIKKKIHLTYKKVSNKIRKLKEFLCISFDVIIEIVISSYILKCLYFNKKEIKEKSISYLKFL